LLAAACLEDRLGEVLHRLAEIHVDASGQDRGDVHTLGVALQHAVGDDPPVWRPSPTSP
jgi:hypothetical protein